jgi:hypothetical protein
MRSRSLVLALALAVAACGGDTVAPAPGPLALGIVSGNHQESRAGAQKLSAAVVGQLVRTRSSGAQFNVVTASGPTLVNGSPITGAVVCAVSIGDTKRVLTPFVPCTNTDTAGKATFFFSTSTTAGEARAEIRGTVANEPAVFDTASAVVMADTVVSAQVRVVNLGTKAVGDSVDLLAEIINAKDAYGNVSTSGPIVWTFSSQPLPTPVTTVPTLDHSGRFATIPAGARSLYAKIGRATLFWSIVAQ